MNFISTALRAILHKYQEHYFSHFAFRYDFENELNTPDVVNDAISSLLILDTPCMISRFGSTELFCILYYIKHHHPFWFLRKIYPFWADRYIGEQMITYSGFFPYKTQLFCHFSDLLIESCKQADILGSWDLMETKIDPTMTYRRCPLYYLEPYWGKNPWSKCLEDKRILVVHPFAETIENQYLHRDALFDNPDVLPPFKSLVTIKAIQSLGGRHNGFSTWFDALHYMENEIDKVDYDVALIGCGAYGMPLAAHCKAMGKKAIHLGGALQLLFGIKGHRWEEEGYGTDWGLDYKTLLNNPYWVRPNTTEKPQNASIIENECYW